MIILSLSSKARPFPWLPYLLILFLRGLLPALAVLFGMQLLTDVAGLRQRDVIKPPNRAHKAQLALQVCRSGMSSNRRIWLTRHGESEFNRNGLVGGNAPLTDKGCQYAEALARTLCAKVPVPEAKDELLPVSCWTSTLCRTIQTAQHIPFPKLQWKALDEIHAGVPPATPCTMVYTLS